MELREIIAIADLAYEPSIDVAEGGIINEAWNGEEVGDGLASFIAFEIKETYSAEAPESDQLQEAARVIGNALDELSRVYNALEAAALIKA